MKRLILSGAVVLLTAGAALAADLAVPPVYYPPPPPLWTGPFAGGSLGFGFGNSGNTVSGKDLFCAGTPVFCDTTTSEGFFLTPGGTANKTSIAGGAQLGYDFQFYNDYQSDMSFIVGGVADLSVLDRSGGTSFTSPPISVGPPVTETRMYSDSFQNNWLSTIRLRLGPTFDNLWIYGTGGLAIGDLRSSSSSVTTWYDPLAPISVFPQVAASGRGSAYGPALGWVVGAGAEFRFAPNWSIFGEYLYYSLAESYTVVVTPNTALTGIAGASSYGVKTHIDGSLVKFGLNYLFWGF